MGSLITILIWLLFGALIGIIAGKIMKVKKGWIMTIIVGIVGAIVGGFIAQLLGFGGVGVDFSFSLDFVISVLIAVGGACLILFIARLLKIIK